MRDEDGKILLFQYDPEAAASRPYFAVVIDRSGIPVRVVLKDKIKKQAVDFASHVTGAKLLSAIHAPTAWITEGKQHVYIREIKGQEITDVVFDLYQFTPEQQRKFFFALGVAMSEAHILGMSDRPRNLIVSLERLDGNGFDGLVILQKRAIFNIDRENVLTPAYLEKRPEEDVKEAAGVFVKWANYGLPRDREIFVANLSFYLDGFKKGYQETHRYFRLHRHNVAKKVTRITKAQGNHYGPAILDRLNLQDEQINALTENLRKAIENQLGETSQIFGRSEMRTLEIWTQKLKDWRYDWTVQDVLKLTDFLEESRKSPEVVYPILLAFLEGDISAIDHFDEMLERVDKAGGTNLHRLAKQSFQLSDHYHPTSWYQIRTQYQTAIDEIRNAYARASTLSRPQHYQMRMLAMNTGGDLYDHILFQVVDFITSRPPVLNDFSLIKDTIVPIVQRRFQRMLLRNHLNNFFKDDAESVSLIDPTEAIRERTAQMKTQWRTVENLFPFRHVVFDVVNDSGIKPHILAWSDRQMFFITFNEVLKNALAALPRESLDSIQRKGRIKIQSKVDPEHIQFLISNDGRPDQKLDAEQIFLPHLPQPKGNQPERIFPDDEGESFLLSGEGVGLFMAKTIAQINGGSLEYDPSYDTDEFGNPITTFRLIYPNPIRSEVRSNESQPNFYGEGGSHEFADAAEVMQFVRQFPLAEGHVHFGSAVPTDLIWELAIRRTELDWGKISQELSETFQAKVDIEAILQEARVILSKPSLDTEGQTRLLALKKEFNRYSVLQPTDQVDLNKFTKINKVGRLVTKGSTELFQELAREIALDHYRNGVRVLTQRASLPIGEAEEEIYQKIIEKASAIKAGFNAAEEKINASLKENEIGLEARLIFTAEKFLIMPTILAQTKALLRVLEERKDLRDLIVAYDVADQERLKAPTEFIPVFELIHQYNQRRRNLGEPELALTYHVGEDFKHVSMESGIRHVAEAVEMGVNGVGHALVLGVDPKRFLGRDKKEHLSEHLAQIYFDLRNEKYDHDALESVGLAIKTVSLWQELEKHASENDYIRTQIVPRIRKILSEATLDVQLQRELYDALNQMKTIYPDSFISNGYHSDEKVEELRKRQNYVLNKLIERQVVIETSPTVNVLIGPIKNHSEHPIQRFLSYEYTGTREGFQSQRPIVTINTDNPNILGINLVNEYAQIAAAFHLTRNDVKRLIENGIQHRLGNFPLRFQEQINRVLATGRSELRRDSGLRSLQKSARNFRERYLVAVDADVFDALSPEQRTEFYKLFTARSEVRFVFNMDGDRRLTPALTELMDFDKRQDNVEVRMTPSISGFQGRKVISVTKKGVPTVAARLLEEKLQGSKDFYPVQYGESENEIGRISAALLYADLKDAAWFQRQPAFEIPASLRSEIRQILDNFLYVSRSA